MQTTLVSIIKKCDTILNNPNHEDSDNVFFLKIYYVKTIFISIYFNMFKCIDGNFLNQKSF